MSLCLHAGARRLNLQQLSELPVPAALGPRHVTRPFAADAELVHRFLEDEGFAVVEEAYGVQFGGRDGETPRQFFGALEIVPKALEGVVVRPGDKDYALTVGLRGSYDQSLPRGLAVGSRVFVCDNTSFSGDIVVHTRQTTFINQRIEGLLRTAVAQVPVVALQQQKRFDSYRNCQIKPRVGDAALVECVRRGILNPSQIGKAVNEWDTPSHEEHAEQNWSLWRLHNAVTEAFKATNPERNNIPVAWDRGVKLTKFLDEVAGL